MFKEKLAKVYDLIYSEDKHFLPECRYISKLINLCNIKGRKLLDVGCGTGEHLRYFKEHGYEVEGLDISKDMLKIAEKKLNGVHLYCCPMDEMERVIKKQYDIVISIFSIIGYLLTNEKIARGLGNIKSALKKKGVFIFDYRNQIAPYIRYKPVTTEKNKAGNIVAVKTSYHRLDQLGNMFVTKHCIAVKEGGKIVKRAKEIQKIRHFTPLEMEYMLKTAGFKNIKMFPYMQTKPVISPDNWRIMTVAR